MIGAHQTTVWLARLDATLPEQVTEAAWGGSTLTRRALVSTIRDVCLPHVVGGPHYQRSVDDNVARAIAAFRRERGEDTLLWLREAVMAAKTVEQHLAA